MAGSGTIQWATGDTVTAANFQSYVQDQVVAVYADATARDAAYGGTGEPTLAEGMVCYLKDTNKIQTYDGSAWADVSTDPAGSDHQVQWNDNGSFGADANFTYDGTTLSVTADAKVYGSANIIQLHNTASATAGGYVGYYTSDGTRIGYVGYAANDDLYIQNEDGDGDVYIESENGRIYYFADTYHFWKVAGTYEMRLDSARLRPYTDVGLSLGDATYRWNVLYVNEIEADDGSASDPSYTFNGDEDTGMYSTTNVLRFTTGGSQRGLFSSSGFYAIKAVSTGTYALWASTGYLVAFSSSERYKENIAPLPKSEWEKIYQLEAKSFDWKEDGSVEIDPNRGKADHGFIAEEVVDILPKVVNYDKVDHEDPESEYVVQSVNYGELTPYLVEAVKDLKARIETLEGS